MLLSKRSRVKSALNQLLDPEFTWIDANAKSSARGQVLQSLPKVANANVEPQLRTYNHVALLRASRATIMFCAFGFTANQAGASCFTRKSSKWKGQSRRRRELPQTTARIPANPFLSFVPETQSEKEAIASWQAVMRAMANNDADAYAPLIADEYCHGHPPRPPVQQIGSARADQKAKLAAARSRPPELTSARMFDFGETMMMMAREQRPNAESYFNTRMWVKRDGTGRCFSVSIPGLSRLDRREQVEGK